jgi:signal transduction histidine kinase
VASIQLDYKGDLCAGQGFAHGVRGDPVPVAAGLALAAYRIVQEAITNAVKHAEGATTVAVELTWAPHRLEIAVTDDGLGPIQSTGSAGGFGLAGIRERAGLYGGTATSGPGERGGWAVKATVPISKRRAP